MRYQHHSIVSAIYANARRLFLAIPADQFSNLKVEQCPDYMKFVEFFNRINQLVQQAILRQDDLKSRVAMLEYWVEVAAQLNALGDFSTPKAIYAAVSQNVAISRLKKTQAHLSERTRRTLEQLKETLENANAREQAFEERQHRVIPYVGFYRVKISGIKERDHSNPDSKGQQIASVVTQLTRMQTQLAAIPETYPDERLLNQLLEPEEGELPLGTSPSEEIETQLYDRSTLVEPKQIRISEADFYNPRLRRIVRDQELVFSDQATVEALLAVNRATQEKLSDREFSNRLKSLGLTLKNPLLKQVNAQNHQIFYQAQIKHPELRDILSGYTLRSAHWWSSTTRYIKRLNALFDGEVAPAKMQEALKSLGVKLDDETISSLIDKSKTRRYFEANPGDFSKLALWKKTQAVFEKEFLPLFNEFIKLLKEDIATVDLLAAHKLFNALSKITDELSQLVGKVGQSYKGEIPGMNAVRDRLNSLSLKSCLLLATNLTSQFGFMDRDSQQIAKEKFGFDYEALKAFSKKVRDYNPLENQVVEKVQAVAQPGDEPASLPMEPPAIQAVAASPASGNVLKKHTESGLALTVAAGAAVVAAAVVGGVTHLHHMLPHLASVTVAVSAAASASVGYVATMFRGGFGIFGKAQNSPTEVPIAEDPESHRGAPSL